VPRKDVPAVLADADCMILPSLFEGCSLSLHEGIGAGLPIIHSKSSGDGLVDGNGLVLPCVSAQAIREAVETVIAKPSLIREWSARSIELAEAHSATNYRRRVVQFARQWLSQRDLVASLHALGGADLPAH
jgi:glycosyltransferase involved in cell wall biosynthesis